MLYKKSKFGRIYIKYVIKSPILFIFFILIGLGLFIFLTGTTKIDTIKKYSAEVIMLQNEAVLTVKDKSISLGSAYVYLNKNDIVYPVTIEKIEGCGEYTTIHLESKSQEVIKLLSPHRVYIEISQGKSTLLYHIFVNGGRRRE